jgi:hypothetical protein
MGQMRRDLLDERRIADLRAAGLVGMVRSELRLALFAMERLRPERSDRQQHRGGCRHRRHAANDDPFCLLQPSVGVAPRCQVRQFAYRAGGPSGVRRMRPRCCVVIVRHRRWCS